MTRDSALAWIRAHETDSNEATAQALLALLDDELSALREARREREAELTRLRNAVKVLYSVFEAAATLSDAWPGTSPNWTALRAAVEAYRELVAPLGEQARWSMMEMPHIELPERSPLRREVSELRALVRKAMPFVEALFAELGGDEYAGWLEKARSVLGDERKETI